MWDIRHSDDEALATGEQRSYALVVADGVHPLKVTLVWADYPGESLDGTLRNNLDLEVISPDGATTYRGNDFDVAAGSSKTGGPADDVNNVEQVLVPAPEPGEWTLRVNATNVAFPGFEDGLQGQGYALVATASRAQFAEYVLWIAVIVVTGSALALFLYFLRIGRHARPEPRPPR